MLVDQFAFRRQLWRFRILTVIGYVMLLLVVVGMVVAGPALEGMVQSIPVAVPVGLVGLVLVFSVVMPFLLAAYDKTTCPHCGGVGERRFMKFAAQVEANAYIMI